MNTKFIFSLLFLTAITYMSSIAQDYQDKQAERKGRLYYNRQDYIRAEPFLREAYSRNPDNAEYAWKAGHAAYESGHRTASLHMLRSASMLNPQVSPQLPYYLASALHANGSYSEAAEIFEAILAGETAGSDRMQDLQSKIAQCKHAPDLVKEPAGYELTNLGQFINTSYPEYASSFTGEQSYMIFTSRRPRKLKQLFGRKYHAEDINEEVYESHWVDGTWMKTRLCQKPIPRWTHDASVSLSLDGQTMFYYIDQRNKGDIYVSRLSDGKWSKRVSIGDNINSDDSHEPSACLSPDGRELFWVSDRPGGVGQKDIYVSTKQEDGSWGAGRNLGGSINTPFEDDAPILSSDGKTLFFASQGHNSMGGYDLFKCERLNENEWSMPVNMGYPVNSATNDIFLVPANTGEGFYLSSDREGGFGDMDLYWAQPSEENALKAVVMGSVTDCTHGKPVWATFEMIDTETGEVVGQSKRNPEEGMFEYSLYPQSKPYQLNIKVGCEKPGPSETGAKHVVSGRIQDAMTQTPLEAVVELLDPMAENAVVGQINSNSSTGNYMLPVESGKSYLLRVKSNEYLPYYERFSVDADGKIQSHYDLIGLQRQGEMNKLVITWQFFDVDQAAVKQDYMADLDNLVMVLNSIPDMNLKIVGHTDSDGSASYNLKLSKQRAESVAQYLVKSGVDSGRLKVSGAGESKPVYPNSNADFKKWNRRVELYLEGE